MHVTIIENPGLIILHNYQHIDACLPIVEWRKAQPDFPISRFKADHWSNLDFEMHHDAPVSIFTYVNGVKQPRISLTGVGLLQCVISLKGRNPSFEVEKMVERVFGQYNSSWSEAEAFLAGLIPYLAREAGTLSGKVPGDGPNQRGWLSTKHERAVQGEFWEAVLGPVGCGAQMPKEWHQWRTEYLDRLNLQAG